MSNPIVEQIGEFLNGKAYTHQGISGTFRYEPDRRMKISHTADYDGRRTPAYRKMRDYLGDDWNTDFTNHDDLCDVALALGFKYNPDEAN